MEIKNRGCFVITIEDTEAIFSKRSLDQDCIIFVGDNLATRIALSKDCRPWMVKRAIKMLEGQLEDMDPDLSWDDYPEVKS